MGLSRRFWAVVAAVMVIGASTTMVRDARAGVQVFYFTSTPSNAPCFAVNTPSYRVKYEWQFGGCPYVSFFTRWRYPFGVVGTCPPDQPSYNPARGQSGSANNVTWSACTVVDPAIQSVFDHCILSGSVPASGFPDVTAIAVGDAIAGPSKLGTSSVGDTVATNIPMRLNVVRSGDTMTLSNFTGQLNANIGRTYRGRPSRARFVLAVYRDSTTAFNANPKARGQALWWGRIDLAKDKTGKKLTVDGDFTGLDFTSPSDPDSLTSLAIPGTINKTVPLAGATEPVVMLYSDPMGGSDALPGTNPVAILALSAAMAGAGLWVMVRRRRVA